MGAVRLQQQLPMQSHGPEHFPDILSRCPRVGLHIMMQVSAEVVVKNHAWIGRDNRESPCGPITIAMAAADEIVWAQTLFQQVLPML